MVTANVTAIKAKGFSFSSSLVSCLFAGSNAIMAFFGLTNLGYQNPIGDKLIVNHGGSSHLHHQEKQGLLRGTETSNINQQPVRSSTDIHHGSHKRYKKMVKLIQTPQSPNQLYIRPLTDNQQYGWMSSESPEPWTQVKRFPRKNSEMTKFVEEMVLTDPDFIMF